MSTIDLSAFPIGTRFRTVSGNVVRMVANDLAGDFPFIMAMPYARGEVPEIYTRNGHTFGRSDDDIVSVEAADKENE